MPYLETLDFCLLFGNWPFFLKYIRAPLRRWQSGYWLGLQASEIFMSRGSLSSSPTGLLVVFTAYYSESSQGSLVCGPLKEQCTTWKLDSINLKREAARRNSDFFTQIPEETSKYFFHILSLVITSLCTPHSQWEGNLQGHENQDLGPLEIFERLLISQASSFIRILCSKTQVLFICFQHSPKLISPPWSNKISQI